jgi:hypothetical protein
MEGSVFWDGWNYQKFIYENLKKLGISQNSVKFIKINNSSLIGAAKLLQLEDKNDIIISI